MADQKAEEPEAPSLRDVYTAGFMRCWRLRDSFIDRGISDSEMEIEQEANKEFKAEDMVVLGAYTGRSPPSDKGKPLDKWHSSIGRRPRRGKYD